MQLNLVRPNRCFSMSRKQIIIRFLGRSVLICVEVMSFTVCFFRLRTGAGILILTQAMPWSYLMFILRAQFARRDNVYFQSGAVKDTDAFVVICNIASSPVIPVPPSPIPRQPVPKVLLETLGSLLDDPLYSDVEFVFPRRGRSAKNPKKI